MFQICDAAITEQIQFTLHTYEHVALLLNVVVSQNVVQLVLLLQVRNVLKTVIVDLLIGVLVFFNQVIFDLFFSDG